MCALGAYTIKNKAWVAAISVFASLLQLALCLLIFLNLTELKDTLYTLAGWAPPLGIALKVDGVSIILLTLTSVLGFFYTVYSIGYFSCPEKARTFWPLWWLLISGLNALFTSNDAFNVYVTLEIIGLVSVGLVALEGTREAVTAALRYLFVGLVGSLFYLLGIVLLYRTYGTLDFTQLSDMSTQSLIGNATLGVITVGLLLKTAIAPLHFWLPAAHGSAPAPVSAVLSALVVKATFYLLARFWLEVLPHNASLSGFYLLGALGVLSILWGSWRALFAKRLKHLIAYSTVAQIGYLFLLFPLAETITSKDGSVEAAFTAVMFMIVAHALAKSALFLAAGSILKAYGHDRVIDLKGIARVLPVTVFTIATAGASLIGLPPSGGFIAKWLLLTQAIVSQQWWLVGIIVVGGLMAAGYIFRFLNIAFDFSQSGSYAPVAKARGSDQHLMILVALVLALFAVILGFNASWIMNTLQQPLGSLHSDAFGAVV